MNISRSCIFGAYTVENDSKSSRRTGYSYLKGKHNWIDFESEISFIIKFLDDNTDDLYDSFSDIYSKLGSEQEVTLGKEKVKKKEYLFRESIYFGGRKDINTVQEFIDLLFENLKKITEALEIYLKHFVGTLDVKKIPRLDVDSLVPDFIISFNYTDTHEKIFGAKECCYIHGVFRENLDDSKKMKIH